MCSDGLTNEVPDREIAEILRSVEDADLAAGSLVERAIRPGCGRDNVTTVVVDVVGDFEHPPDSAEQLVLSFHGAARG